MDYIQSEIRLIHIDGGSQTTKPTEATANTEPQTPEQINNTRITNTNPKDNKSKTSMTGIEGAKRVVGKYSVIRRGIGIAFDEFDSFYIPLRSKTGTLLLDDKAVVSCVTELLTSLNVVGHNIIYDALVWKHRYGIDFVANISDDTILMKHLINEERPFGLKEVAVQYLGPESDKAQERLYASIAANGF